MQKKIRYVLLLMSGCVLGITGLQLYWNYENYKTTVSNFKSDANDALEIAVTKEIALRHDKLVLKVKNWLADTSFLRIECNTNNIDSNTVFVMQDVNPRIIKNKIHDVWPFEVHINKFKQKLKKITPEAKMIFINHFAETIFKRDMEDGSIYYYTQNLGDSISIAFQKSTLNKKDLTVLFKKELLKKEINSSFKLNPSKPISQENFSTKKVNSSIRKPYEADLVWASLENPNNYYFREMKGLIFTSFLLIAITIVCFYYTVKTLFNQYKLVAIKNQFISNITHEINTPLSSIQITTEALKHLEQDEETREKYLDIILYQTQKLNELSKEILESAKLETLGFTTKEEVDLKELIYQLIKDLEFDEKALLKYNLPKKKIIIKGNKVHLKRALANVLENAFKYNPSKKPTIELKLTEAKNRINLSIIDDGPGIADEFKSRIFEQFYRIPTGNVHTIKGYGLGLSYVKKVILQHGGSIQVMDNQPKGSIFSINLPTV